MSALADALRALIPIADYYDGSLKRIAEIGAARDVFRKHAPCERCGGTGGLCATMPPRCAKCSGAGWTTASVEAAIDKAEELDTRIRELVNVATVRNDERLNNAALAVRELLP
jgi:hypothetical protein